MVSPYAAKPQVTSILEKVPYTLAQFLSSSLAEPVWLFSCFYEKRITSQLRNQKCGGVQLAEQKLKKALIYFSYTSHFLKIINNQNMSCREFQVTDFC